MAKVQKISPFLWFDNQAEQAANLYVSLFPDSKILTMSRYGEGGLGPKGSVMVAEFQLAGQHFMAINGGPLFKHSEAFSLMVHAVDQDEVDRLWAKLTADGGQESQCGWLKDRFGVSWQIVPTRFDELMRDPDPARSGRVMKAMMGMRKLELAQLEAAYAGR